MECYLGLNRYDEDYLKKMRDRDKRDMTPEQWQTLSEFKDVEEARRYVDECIGVYRCDTYGIYSLLGCKTIWDADLKTDCIKTEQKMLEKIKKANKKDRVKLKKEYLDKYVYKECIE